MGIVDKDLRHTAAPIAASGHGITTRLITINTDLRVGRTLAIQQRLGTDAERTRLPGVDLNLGHHKKSSVAATLCSECADSFGVD